MLEFRHAIIFQAKSHRVWSRQSIEWSSSGHSAISYGTKHDRSGQNNGIRECFRGWDSNPKVCLQHFLFTSWKQSKFLGLFTNSRYTHLNPLSRSSVLVPRFRFGIYHWHYEKKSGVILHCSNTRNLHLFVLSCLLLWFFIALKLNQLYSRIIT